VPAQTARCMRAAVDCRSMSARTCGWGGRRCPGQESGGEGRGAGGGQGLDLEDCDIITRENDL
jgi:hypothetical protein